MMGAKNFLSFVVSDYKYPKVANVTTVQYLGNIPCNVNITKPILKQKQYW